MWLALLRGATYPRLSERAVQSPTWSYIGLGLPCRFCRLKRGELLPHLFTFAC